jgi:hypothetical protein
MGVEPEKKRYFKTDYTIKLSNNKAIVLKVTVVIMLFLIMTLCRTIDPPVHPVSDFTFV